MPEIGSSRKITYHREKLDAYLRGEYVFPATLELDLTSVCNRHCPNCASNTRLPPCHLPTEIVKRLLASLEGQTRGLILTGGEPTLAPNFSETLHLARQAGFEEVVVVTNGTFLGEEKIAAALLDNTSAVRVSLYDWDAESCAGLAPTLKRIEALRARIEHHSSPLQIGVSALTSTENTSILSAVAEKVRSAGAHWIYFHPLCTKWNSGEPSRVDQAGVLERIARIRKDVEGDFGVFVLNERYTHEPIEFNGYHASNFLLVIGADGMNYLAPEVKYQRHQIIADIRHQPTIGFLWERNRSERIQNVQSKAYPALGSRHRGILYNHLIERFIRSHRNPVDEDQPAIADSAFLFPHIL